MLEQYREIVGADTQPHLVIQQVSRFLLGEGELLGADLVHLSPRPEPPQWQQRVGAGRKDEVDFLGEVPQKVGYRLLTALLGYELEIIDHNYHTMVHLGELVYEHGERYLKEILP